MGCRAVRVHEITDDDVEAVLGLWQRAGLTRPWNDARADIAFARQSPTATVLVGRVDGTVAGAVMVGQDGHRGTVYYLGTDPDRRGQGHGRALMAAAEGWLRDQGVWKTNLLVREGNAAALRFYAALGYVDQACHVLGRRLDGRADRTPLDAQASAGDADAEGFRPERD